MTAMLMPPDIREVTRAMLIDELSRVEGKAEIINGKVVCMSPGKQRHGRAWGRI